MTIHCHENNQFKHSQSPVLIRHHMPLEFSLKIINSIRMKTNHQAREENHLRKIIYESAVKNSHQSPQSIFIFKNESCQKFAPQVNISNKKISKAIKNYKQLNKNESLTESIVLEGSNEFIMTQNNKLVRKNSLMDLFSKTKSNILEKKEAMIHERNSNKIRQVGISSSQVGLEKRHRITQNSIRKNSMMYNFKRDLGSSKSARSMKQQIRKSETLQTEKNVNSEKILINKGSKRRGKLEKDVLEKMMISGSKVPDFEVRAFSSKTLTKLLIPGVKVTNVKSQCDLYQEQK